MSDGAPELVDDADDFDADEFIDRTAERNLFRELVGCNGPKRLLTIRDESDHGKSRLLRQLEWMCGWEMEPPVAAGLVPVDQFQTIHAVVSQAAKGLKNGGCVLSRFTEIEDERINRRKAIAAAISGEVHSGTTQGGTQTGVAINAPLTINAGEADPEVQDALRESAIEAFLEDLADVSREKPVVLLIDAYEKGGRELKQWIPAFVRDHVLNSDRQLIVVIAGQTVPTRPFKVYLKDRFDELVTMKESLSQWDREHVAEFLTINGVSHTQADVDHLYTKLREGWSIGRALRTVRQYKREEELEKARQG